MSEEENPRVDAPDLYKYKVRVTITLRIPELEKVDSFKRRFRIKDRSTAIVQLVDAALHVESKIGLAQTWTSADLEEIKAQLETGQLVDYVAQLPQEKFRAIMNIIKTETEARYGQTKLQ